MADRAFFRDVLGLPNVDAGGGWLIFSLPPAEVAFDPSDKNGPHEFYLICEDAEAFMADLQDKGVACSPVKKESGGLRTNVTLPGGGAPGVYQPLH